MAPSPTEREELFRGFARALFKGDIDALYRVVTPDFLWTFHDGLAVTKSLADPAARPKRAWIAANIVAPMSGHCLNLPSWERADSKALQPFVKSGLLIIGDG